MKKAVFTICFIVSSLAVSTAAQVRQTVTDTEAKLVSIPDYQISAAGEAASLDGKIVISAKVDKKGEVKKATAIAGPMWPCGSEPTKEIEAVLDEVERNLLSAKFTPAIKDGKPVESEVAITVLIGWAYRFSKQKREPDNPKEPGAPSAKIIRGGVLNGKATYLARPEYPEAARKKKIRGQVTIEILIDEEGKVISAGSVGGPRDLHKAARAAACSSKYSPTTLVGHPVKVAGVIVYNFTK